MEVPTFTLPKLRAVGESVSCPTVTPVPVKGTFRLGPDIKMLPLATELVCGLKVTSRVRLCPGESASGKVGPLTEKPVPDN